jgi:hypothetical protein
MKEIGKKETKSNRRAFLKKGVSAAGVATAAGMVIPGRLFAQSDQEDREDAGLTRGDIAILRFLSAAEQVETDL